MFFSGMRFAEAAFKQCEPMEHTAMKSRQKFHSATQPLPSGMRSDGAALPGCGAVKRCAPAAPAHPFPLLTPRTTPITPSLLSMQCYPIPLGLLDKEEP